MIKLGTVLLACLLWLVSCGPQPPQPPTFKLDHFKAYDLDIIESKEPGTVRVNDQFVKEESPQGVDVELTKIKYFATAVRKNDESIKNPLAHLAWYRTPLGIVRDYTITIVNQMTDFEEKKINIQRLRALLVPTGKEGEGFPEDLDHYLCYQVIGGSDSIVRKVTLNDPQFEQQGEVEVRGPSYFCNPCSKISEDGTFQIKNKEDHLAVYLISPGNSVDEDKAQKTIINQFDGQVIKVKNQIFLFVPTKKVGFEPTPPGD
jgi:hypothetical protein